MNAALRILAADLLICDVIVPAEVQKTCADFLRDYNKAHPDHPVRPGSKSPLTRDEYLRLRALVPESALMFPGGSSANALSVLKRLAAERVHIDFIGAAGAGRYGHVIDQSLKQDGFHMLPEGGSFPDVETAVSFVMVNGGDRSILTYAGTSRDKIRGDVRVEEAMRGNDVLFLQGSLWPKFGEAFAQALVVARAQQNKRLWFALPTHSKLGEGHQRMFSDIIPTAEIVLANADELRRIYSEDDLSPALADLQLAFQPGTVPNQCAFITDAAAGAMVVTSDNIIRVPAVPAERVNTLGAGDAAFAGFLYGRLCALDYAQSAHIAMILAAQTLQIHEARLSDPHRYLPRN